MFSKTIFSALALLTLASSVSAHAAFFPQLGVKGTPVRGNVQRPSAAKPCGTENIASTLDTTTPVVASANGQFKYTAINFNAGVDGSRQVKTVKVDPTGTGTKFVAAKMVTNGDLNPSSTGTQAIVGQLPAGTKCTGGKNKNLCLVSFTSAGGFGNCAVVQQGGAAAKAGGAAKAAAPAKADAPAKKTAAKKGSSKKGGAQARAEMAATLAARVEKLREAKRAVQAARSWASRRSA
ncbi:hypothetical protein BV25DRAFT_1916000 [Artomyces pyxidatus]|uniref:Uncharacterized protein n=1 Tax=Artomyces pyxidatus TaxID=48021 RepID=A0ACB8T2X2_9AGAM|nr:hypothetical protein BV25DRAFT_1916000 [Artomyces pyxidatus]